MKSRIYTPAGYLTMSSEIKNAHNYNTWIISKIKSFIGESLIEIGTGYGNYYELLKPFCNVYYSIDVDQSVIEIAKNKYPDCTFFLGDITDINFIELLSKKQIDTVVCINVLEHIENDKLAVVNMFKILNKKGYLIVFVPAYNSLYSSMDRFAGHLRRYTLKTFGNLIKDMNIEICLMEYFNPIGGIGWYLNKFINHDALDSKLINRQIKIFNEFITPISKVLNPLTRRFFGQSLLFVGRKTN